jgi:nicotinamidase-related amidase
MSDDELRKLADKRQFHIVIRKEELNPFSNLNLEKLIKILGPRLVVIFGVALDLCVRQAVEGLLNMGGIKVFLLRDAVKGLGLKGDNIVLEQLRKKGVEIIKLADLEKKF